VAGLVLRTLELPPVPPHDPIAFAPLDDMDEDAIATLLRPLPARVRVARLADGEPYLVRAVGPLHAQCTLVDMPLHLTLSHPHVAAHAACVVGPGGWVGIAKRAPPVHIGRRGVPDAAVVLRDLQDRSDDAKRLLAAQAVSAIAYLHAHGLLCMCVGPPRPGCVAPGQTD
jgi:hypothetical protein